MEICGDFFIKRSALTHLHFRSATCWINDRWQIKVGGFGCRTFVRNNREELQRMNTFLIISSLVAKLWKLHFPKSSFFAPGLSLHPLFPSGAVNEWYFKSEIPRSLKSRSRHYLHWIHWINILGQLWWSPELIRNPGDGSQQADIYAFAIICSEILTKKLPFDIANHEDKLEGLLSDCIKVFLVSYLEFLYMLKRGNSSHPLRPLLDLHEDIEVNTALVISLDLFFVWTISVFQLHLVRDCWEEDPSRRPNIQAVRSVIKSIVSQVYSLLRITLQCSGEIHRSKTKPHGSRV